MAQNLPTIYRHEMHKLSEVDGPCNYVGHPNGTPEREKHSYRPIHRAAENKYDNITVVEMLLDRGADVNVRAWNGMTALHMAACWANLRILKTLLERGADTSLVDEMGLTPLHCAAFEYRDELTDSQIQNRISVIKSLLLKKLGVNDRTRNKETPLMFAVKDEFENLEVVKVLLNAGADLHLKNDDDETCLHTLLLHPGKTSAMVHLIKAGAPIHDRNKDGKDAIGCIVDSKNRSVDQKAEELRAFIKVATLVRNSERVDFSINRIVRYRIGRFADECHAEVQRMKYIKLTRRTTLCDFAIHGEKSPRIMDLVFERLAKQDFKIYYDYIASSFEKSYLICKIFKMGIHAESDLGAVMFPNFLISKFCEIFSKQDLLNILKVMTDSPRARL